MDPSDPNTARLALRVDGGTVSASDWAPDGRSLIVTQRIGTGSGKQRVTALTMTSPDTSRPKNGRD